VDDPERAERVRQASGLIVDAARVQQEMLDLEQFERGIGRPPWRDLLKELRHDHGRFAAAAGDKSARIALRWALRDLGLAALRRAIDRVLERGGLQRDGGRTDRVDRVMFGQGVGSAVRLLTGRPLGRSLTVGQRRSEPDRGGSRLPRAARPARRARRAL
jgi:hypothetical protein